MRTARFLTQEGCYYVYSRSYDYLTIVRNEDDFQKYISLIKRYKKICEVSLYAYCILPTCVHLILHPQQFKKLPDFMKRLQQSYAIYINQQLKRGGKVWRDRYTSRFISNDRDLVEGIKSIEFIPVMENLAFSSIHYSWSSCSYRVFGNKGILDCF